MSTENIETIVEPNETDLDAFAAELFGQKEAAPEQASSEGGEKDDEESDAKNGNDTQTDETDTLETEDEDETKVDETSDDADDKSKSDEKANKPKNRFQERIDELTAKAKDAERREQDMARRFQELEQKLTSQPKDEKTKPAVEDSGPSVDETNEDGSEKYPLGEFDPNYIRDLTKFTLRQESEKIEAEKANNSLQKQYEAEKAELQKSWTEKVVPAKERYPDFQEKGEHLFETFAGIPQAYGEYLTATLMSMENGPDVLYYLANNLDEANKIVAGGPTKATLALGALNAKYLEADVEKQKARPKVSQAPTPPDTQLKGTNAVMPDVADDTDDLDAFSRKLFKKKK